MTFSNALSSLRTGQAMYMPDMRGYICRVDRTPDSTYSQITDYVFVENTSVDPYGGSADAATEYVFTKKVAAADSAVTWLLPNQDSAASVSSGQPKGQAVPFVLDAAMFAAMFSSDWTVCTLEEAAARKTALGAASRW